MNISEIGTADEVKVHAQKEVKKMLKHVGTIKPQRGQTVWQMDLNKGVVEPAAFEEAVVEVNGSIRKKLVIKQDFLYCTALNLKNAHKKFLKLLYAAH